MTEVLLAVCVGTVFIAAFSVGFLFGSERRWRRGASAKKLVMRLSEIVLSHKECDCDTCMAYHGYIEANASSAALDAAGRKG